MNPKIVLKPRLQFEPQKRSWFRIRINILLICNIAGVCEPGTRTGILDPLADMSHMCCAAGFALLNLPKGKSLGRSKPETNSSNEQAH